MLSNKSWVKHTPIISTLIFESGNVAHVLRMYKEKSAAGQSLMAWVFSIIALLLWLNWYRLFTPEQKIAKWSTLGGITLSAVVIITIIKFRFFS